MKTLHTLTVFLILGAFAHGLRAESVLQFESPGLLFSQVGSVQEDGFIFSAPLHAGFVNGGGLLFRNPPTGINNVSPDGSYTVPYNGTEYTVPFTGSEPVLSQTNSLPFTLESLDYAPYSAGLGLNPNTLAVTGYYAGGGTITKQFVWNGVVQGLPGDFQTFVFDKGWTNLNQVVMFASIPNYGSYAAFSIDNITVTTVPEPETLALLGLSLVSLALTLRRRNTRLTDSTLC